MFEHVSPSAAEMVRVRRVQSLEVTPNLIHELERQL